jgi:hypothetical protein
VTPYPHASIDQSEGALCWAGLKTYPDRNVSENSGFLLLIVKVASFFFNIPWTIDCKQHFF